MKICYQEERVQFFSQNISIFFQNLYCQGYFYNDHKICCTHLILPLCVKRQHYKLQVNQSIIPQATYICAGTEIKTLGWFADFNGALSFSICQKVNSRLFCSLLASHRDNTHWRHMLLSGTLKSSSSLLVLHNITTCKVESTMAGYLTMGFLCHCQNWMCLIVLCNLPASMINMQQSVH